MDGLDDLEEGKYVKCTCPLCPVWEYYSFISRTCAFKLRKISAVIGGLRLLAALFVKLKLIRNHKALCKCLHFNNKPASHAAAYPSQPSLTLKYDIDIEFGLTEPKLNINVNVRERERVVKQACYLSVNIYKEVW